MVFKVILVMGKGWEEWNWLSLLENMVQLSRDSGVKHRLPIPVPLLMSHGAPVIWFSVIWGIKVVRTCASKNVWRLKLNKSLLLMYQQFKRCSQSPGCSPPCGNSGTQAPSLCLPHLGSCGCLHSGRQEKGAKKRHCCSPIIIYYWMRRYG